MKNHSHATIPLRNPDRKTEQLHLPVIRTLANFCFKNGNYQEAFRLYQRCVRLGDTSALNFLGTMYEQGLYVKPNSRKALKCYFKGYLRGNPLSTYYVGLWYQHRSDYIQAIYYYQISAEKRCVLALIALGEMYEDGLEVEKDLAKAEEYFRKAGNRGFYIRNPECLDILFDKIRRLEKEINKS